MSYYHLDSDDQIRIVKMLDDGLTLVQGSWFVWNPFIYGVLSNRVKMLEKRRPMMNWIESRPNPTLARQSTTVPKGMVFKSKRNEYTRLFLTKGE